MLSTRTNRTTIRRDCRCPRARHQHGTRDAYNRDQCRCDPCTAANAVHAATGAARPYLPPGDWGAMLAAAVLVTAAAVHLPARRALRGRAVEAAAERE